MSENNFNLLVQALKKNFRFTVPYGQISTEDLFRLSLEKLDEIARGLHAELQVSGVSFIDASANAKSKELSDKLEIVKLAISEVQADLADKKAKAASAAERRRLLEALHNADSKELASLSKEEITARLAALEN